MTIAIHHGDSREVGKMKPAPLKERIRAALSGGPRSYYAVMHDVFPEEQFPRAWRASVNGGPPGCAFAFGRALREMGVYESSKDKGRILTLPREAAATLFGSTGV